MEAREQQVDTAIILMDAAVKIYKMLGMTKEQAKAEVMRNRPSDVPVKLEDQMSFLFDTSWSKING